MDGVRYRQREAGVIESVLSESQVDFIHYLTQISSCVLTTNLSRWFLLPVILPVEDSCEIMCLMF